MSEVPGLDRERPLRHAVLRLAAVFVPLVILGEAGHLLLERLHAGVAHHFFHIFFGAGAVIVFTLWTIADIRKNGWPTFTWRLREDDEDAAAHPAAPRG